AASASGNTQHAAAENKAANPVSAPTAARPRSPAIASEAGSMARSVNFELQRIYPYVPPVAATESRKFDMTGWSIGELARLTGVHVETIRYFEKVGLLDSPGRTAGGHRVFDGGHLRSLKFIKRARELGFSPREVRALLDLGGPEQACCDEVREI